MLAKIMKVASVVLMGLIRAHATWTKEIQEQLSGHIILTYRYHGRPHTGMNYRYSAEQKLPVGTSLSTLARECTVRVSFNSGRVLLDWYGTPDE